MKLARRLVDIINYPVSILVTLPLYFICALAALVLLRLTGQLTARRKREMIDDIKFILRPFKTEWRPPGE